MRILGRSKSGAFLQAVPAAHRGFLLRARQVPIEAMYEHACRQKRRLVLSGGHWSTRLTILVLLLLLDCSPLRAKKESLGIELLQL